MSINFGDKWGDEQDIEIFCDGCDYSHSEIGHFSEIWQDLKDEGWRCRRVKNEWEHYCPDCSGVDKEREG